MSFEVVIECRFQWQSKSTAAAILEEKHQTWEELIEYGPA